MTRDEERTADYKGANPEQVPLAGSFRIHRGFHSDLLGADAARDVVIYLPPQYEEEPDRRFPVLYMHDGQNLFDPATAFAGQPWNVDETAEGLIRAGEVEPVIIVGIYNTGAKRIEEYTPTPDKKHASGGGGRLYSRFLREELKPFVDRSYRTLVDSEHTGIAGSSLGGLISLYIGLHHPDVFGRLGVMSPSVWWNRRMILRLVRSLKQPTTQKIWVDVGTSEGAEALRNVRDLRELLLTKGWVEGVNFGYLEDEGAGHDERAWGWRMANVLRFLYGARKV